ncbi:hypothetical protein DSL92_07800 [Billgrantia gudaonensis]|uniref:Uncharacterized protein n=1 Tax=Billgrantia gudaonensis TaxID=376427 RepID=A0A432JGN7_9GAMM|nr:hypothetical protein DSL92_07800 [Halomonas gudaonensis]
MVVRAQLATDLDLTFISDHDSRSIMRSSRRASERRGALLPSVEVSPSWGHINPFPSIWAGELEVIRYRQRAGDCRCPASQRRGHPP